MNHRRSSNSFKLTLAKALTLLILIGLLVSCKKDNTNANNGPLAGGYSILVNNGNILVSGFKSEGNLLSTKYWINGESAEQSKFTELVGNHMAYRQGVDEKYRTGYSYKDRSGEIQNYRFDQSPVIEKGFMFYYKNNTMQRLANDSIGLLSAVTFNDDNPTFAGSLGEMTTSIAGNLSYYPKTAFIWDGHSSMLKLKLPVESSLFWGVSTIYSNSPNEFYVGGLCGVPMYWKNSDPVVLDKRFGEVWQITKSGSDIYAVGLINKYNSNSAGHTACYWKNGVIQELGDDAQAYGIFVEGNNIYVTGAVGKFPSNYRPCYWKNGQRVDLPM